MSESWHEDEELDFLPKSALNPLVNPLLERHLGRWAEVYFTSAPDKREQAVAELLQELERESQGNAEIPEHPATQVDRTITLAEMVCPRCDCLNFEAQKFCGNCGSPLPGSGLPPAAEEPPAATTGAFAEMPSLQLLSKPEQSDMQWLRERTFSQWDGTKAPVRQGRKLLGAGFLLIVLLAAFGYLRWVSRDRPTPSSPAAAVVPPVATQPVSQSPDSLPAEVPTQQAPPEVRGNRAHEPKAKVAHSSPHEASALPSAADGSQELVLAEQRLSGKAGFRDSAAAAKLLWKAVGKQNVQAALLLSDLYARGDGVARNCDQARLLLIAAAKKGGTAAAQQLRSFDSSPCP